VVVVDATEPEVGRAGAATVGRLLERLPEAWACLEQETAAMTARGWSAPVRIDRARLPIFRFAGGRRERLASDGGACPPAVIEGHRRRPEEWLPNVWLRPLLQDAALATHTALLGGAELAYHLQACGLWALAGLPRPHWRLRPHVTVVTAAERRLIRQLGIEPVELLSQRPPARLLPARGARRAAERFTRALGRDLEALEAGVAGDLPGLEGDLAATRRKLEAATSWLGARVEAAATRAAEVELGRWGKLRGFLRPNGRPQERELSVLAPLLRLGPDWPRALAAALDPGHPGMHLLCWEEGGRW
jgi:uncharacterized protein YllA (UPF0747 family)